MSNVRDFRDLTVWQRSVDFAVEVYKLSRGFPADERFGMTSQLRSAAISVSSNIAEGSARSAPKDRRNFYGISGGSLKEGESLLLVSQRLGFTTESDCATAMSFADETSRMLTRMRQNLSKR
jgi:four helix bundle protein